MKNFLTLKVESWVGGILIFGMSAFLVGLFILAVRNFGSDIDIMNSASPIARSVSSQEKMLIDEWVKENDPSLSVQEVGYRYIMKKFPDKPWLK